MIINHLSRILGERRWTQLRLSQETGIRPTTISNLYNDVAEQIGFDQLDRICEALNCTLYDLLEYTPNEHPRTGEQLIREQHGNRRM